MIQTKMERITPAKAKKLLETNTQNRAISSRVASKYSMAMRRGEWQSNGQPLVIGKDGTLLDGQHRLTAIINSETTQRMLVVSGVDNTVADTIDTGKPRSPGDALGMAGYAQPHALATTARFVYSYCDDPHFKYPRKYSNPQILSFVEDNPIEQWAAAVSIYSRAKNLGHRSVMAGFFYILAVADPYKAPVFFERLISGEELKRNDPILALRNKMLMDRMEKSQRLSQQAVAAAVIRAWNAHHAGRTLQTLRCKTSDFPEIRGLDYDAFVLAMISDEQSRAVA